MQNTTQQWGSLTIGSTDFRRQDSTKETFGALKRFIAGGRSKVRRSFKLQSTTAILAGDRVDIQYHDTIILSFWSDRFMINSGGWRTMSTKARINEFVPRGFNLSQNRSVWYLNGLPFYDGMIVIRDRIEPDAKAKKELARVVKIKRQVKAYCDKLAKMIDNHTLKDPGGGDCWLCMMKNTDGKLVDGMGHLMSHLEQKYVHGTLVWNALEDQGCDVDFLWRAYYRGCDKSGVFKRYAVSAVRRWFYRNLGIAR